MGFLHFSRLTVSCAVVISLFACSGGSGSNSGTSDAKGDFFSQRSDLALAALATTTDANGEAHLTIDLPAGATKFSVTGTSGVYIATDTIIGADGTVHLDFNGEQKNLATIFEPFVTSANTPSRDFDTPIAGGSYAVSMTAASGVNEDGTYTPAAGETVNVTTVSSSDSDLTSGVLPVNLIYVGGTGANADYRSAVQSASTRFAAIYAAMGIQVQITEAELDGPTILPSLSTGDPTYLILSSLVAYPALNICVGYDIQEGTLLGISGGIPGAPVPTVKSCVAVSMLTNGGPSGVFDASSVELLAETLAHEGGHYLGLFHPVESNLATFDPLIDTPLCSGQAECEALLGTNLMYPYPISNGAGGWQVQDALTPQQGGVMNRYVAVS